MFRTLPLVVALGAIASAPHLPAQGQTRDFLEATRKFTTYAPLIHYPASARARHLQGSGIYLLHVRTDGTVERVDIVKSTGYRELDDISVATYKQWRFRKEFATKAHKVRIPVTFALSR